LFAYLLSGSNTSTGRLFGPTQRRTTVSEDEPTFCNLSITSPPLYKLSYAAYQLTILSQRNSSSKRQCNTALLAFIDVQGVAPMQNMYFHSCLAAIKVYKDCINASDSWSQGFEFDAHLDYPSSCAPSLYYIKCVLDLSLIIDVTPVKKAVASRLLKYCVGYSDLATPYRPLVPSLWPSGMLTTKLKLICDL